MQSIDFYTRSQQPWTDDEIDAVVDYYISENKDIIWIGNQQKRTPGSIAFKIKSKGHIANHTQARGYSEYRNSALYAAIVETSAAKRKAEKTVEPEKPIEEAAVVLETASDWWNKTHEPVENTIETVEHSPINMIGAPWSDAEEHQLLKELAEGKTYEQIAKIHGRKANGISCRIKHIARNMASNGISMGEIQSKTGLSNSAMTKIRKMADDVPTDATTKKVSNEELYTLLIDLHKKMDTLLESVQ